MFADDNNLTASGNTIMHIQEKLNNDLEYIYQWLLANKLTVNRNKTEYMIAGSRQQQLLCLHVEERSVNQT
jgi:hypothetical protein